MPAAERGRTTSTSARIAGAGPYTLETASDDLDGDGAADASDVCPRAFDPLQRDWDRDRRGDRCDRSARVILTGVKRTRVACCSYAPACGPPRCRPRAFRLTRASGSAGARAAAARTGRAAPGA